MSDVTHPARVDLHAHTTASDGTLTPSDLVRAALAAGLDVLAVTDHDTVSGFVAARAAARGTALRVLPGLELSAIHPLGSLHLLGYGFDPDDAGLHARLQALTMGRVERARAIVERLNELGIALSWERVEAQAGGTVGRPHIARVLVESGYARDNADAFARFLGEGSPAYLPSGRLTPAEAIAMVRSAGGVVALAHSQIPAKPLDLAVLLPELSAVGLTGLEVYHAEHDAATAERLRRIADDHHLWWCGGSDYHGLTRSQVRLGSVAVPPEVLDQGPFAAALRRY